MMWIAIPAAFVTGLAIGSWGTWRSLNWMVDRAERVSRDYDGWGLD